MSKKHNRAPREPFDMFFVLSLFLCILVGSISLIVHGKPYIDSYAKIVYSKIIKNKNHQQ